MFKTVLGSGVEKDRPFPHYAIDYFQQIREQYDLVVQHNPSYRQPATITRIFERVDAALAARDSDATRRRALQLDVHWGDVFALETAMIYALPDTQLASALWSMRLRFREVAGQDEYDEYMRCSISDAAKPAPVIRADLLSLSGRMRYLYTFTPTVETQRNHVSRFVALLTLICIVIFASAFVWYSRKDLLFFDYEALLLVVFMGAIGGFISIQQRLQQVTRVDPLIKELELAESGIDTLASPLLGAIFAAVLYLVFLSNFVSGDIFPSFTCTNVHEADPLFKSFLLCAAPKGPSDWGKLLVWAFIAGFAERLVPDVLTRLASGGVTTMSGRTNTAVPTQPVQWARDEIGHVEDASKSV